MKAARLCYVQESSLIPARNPLLWLLYISMSYAPDSARINCILCRGQSYLMSV
jgi:hypothetical protein